MDPDDPAVILMSGGTTGIPTGAVGRHAGLVAAGLQMHAWLWVDLGSGARSLRRMSGDAPAGQYAVESDDAREST